MPHHYWTHNLDMFILRSDYLDYRVNLIVGVICLLIWGGCGIMKKKLPTSKAIHYLQVVSYIGISLSVALSIIKYVGGFRWYTALFITSIILCFLTMRHWAKQGFFMITPALLDRYVNYLIIGVLVGARVFYILVYNRELMKRDPWVIVRTWEGGLSFHGGLLGVIIASLLFCYRYKMPFWHLTDRIALCIPIGLFLVRIGNFMNGELYGRLITSHIPWAIIFENTGGGPYPRHPSQIYESLGEGILLPMILWGSRKFFRSEGQMSSLFLLGYGSIRYLIEFFREPDRTALTFFNGNMTTGQLLCSLMILSGIVLMFLTRNNLEENSILWQKRYEEYMLNQFNKS